MFIASVSASKHTRNLNHKCGTNVAVTHAHAVSYTHRTNGVATHRTASR